MPLSSDDILKCRLRVRDVNNCNWYDVCNNKTFIRDAENEKWIPMYAGSSFVQVPEYMRKWLLISCDFDPEFDNPCDDETLAPAPCVGQPNDEEAGSGNGVGSNGAKYTEQHGYPTGYDLPDAGIAGFRLIQNRESPSGYMIFRPVLGVPHTYRKGIAGGTGRGTWLNPLVEYDTLSTGNTKITESIVDISGITGCLPIYFSNSEDCCTAIDAYVDGKRIATTCGPACSSGVLNVCPPARKSDKMLVRFTKMIDETDCNTDIKVGPEVPDGGEDIIIPPDDPSNGGGTILPGGGGNDKDGDGEHDGGIPDKDGDGEPDLPDIGTPLFPLPCGATIRPDWATLKNNVVSYTHFVGNESGRASLCFKALSGNMIIDVLYQGAMLASTRAGIVSGCLEFSYTYRSSQYITVRITTTDATPNGWEYSLYCIRDGGVDDEDGSERYPISCNQIMHSTGAPIHKHWYDMHYGSRGEKFDRSIVVINCDPMGSDKVVFSVYDQRDQLIDTYQGSDRGVIQMPRIKTEHGTDRDTFYVYVEAPTGLYWEYHINCPVQLIDIEVEGEIVPWTPSAARP